jgi:sulfite exporter TauE/SafE
MIGICIAHLTGHGTDSSITVVLAVVAGVILVLLALASVHRAEWQASSGESERRRRSRRR